MALFKPIYCDECGAKTTPVFRAKLQDGKCLCQKCAGVIPLFVYDSLLKKYTLDDYHDFKEHIEYSNIVLRPQFQETAHYHSIHLDENNYIFYLGNKIKEDTVFLELSCVVDFDILFNPEDFKEGILGDVVYGNVLFEIDMFDPMFHHEEKLATHVKTKAKKKLFGSKITYENPPDMEAFLIRFQNAWISCCNDSHEDNAEDSAIQKAMTLFMYDSLEGITIDELKNQRNRLIKAFHPDAGSDDDTVFAQKINGAYALLKAHVENDGQ